QIAGGGFSHGAVAAGGGDPPTNTIDRRTPVIKQGTGTVAADAEAGPFLDDNIAMTQAFLALYRSTARRDWLRLAVSTLEFIDTPLRAPHAGYTASRPVADSRGVFRDPVRDVAQNAAVARTANMLHHYTANPRQLQIAHHAMKYLSAFAASASDQFRPDILL